jgi:hypothetical protein
VRSPIPPTGASFLATMPRAEHAAILQEYMNADEEHMDDDEESYDDDEEEQYMSELYADAYAPVAQALASLTVAVEARANQQVPLPPIQLRGIQSVTLDIRRAHANLEKAFIAGNFPVIESEQSFLAFYQNELAALRERLQGSCQRY